MSRSIALLVILFAAAATAACAATPAPLPMLVTPEWLAAHVHDKDVVLLHVGEEDAYARAHIAGARRAGLGDVATTTDGLSVQIPADDDLRVRLEGLGISDGSRVIVYFGSDWASAATRVVLTLDRAGVAAALLDGGMPAWQRAGQPVTAAPTPVRKGRLTRVEAKPVIVDASTVVASLGAPGVAVVDARDRVLYDGVERGGMPGHQHATGHIRGAHSLPYTSVFDAEHRLLPDAKLAELFAAAGVAPGDTVIAYCHIGIQATAVLFAARRLGHPVRLYDGSFEDWSRHAGFPVENPAAKAATP